MSYCPISGAITSNINGFTYTPGIEEYAHHEFNKLYSALVGAKQTNAHIDYGEGVKTILIVYDNGIAILRATDGVKTACFYTVVAYKTKKSFVEGFGDCGRQAMEAAQLNKSFTGV